MKTLHIPLEDKEYKALIKAKRDQTWKDFLIEIATEINKKEVEKKRATA